MARAGSITVGRREYNKIRKLLRYQRTTVGFEETFHSGEFQGADKHELERVRVQLSSSSHFFPYPPVLPDPPVLAVPPLPFLSGGCRRRGAGLVLDHGAAASSGTARGGLCEGGRPDPRGRPGLPRAPTCKPQSPMCRPLEMGGSDSGRPRMGGTGCHLGGETRCAVLGGDSPRFISAVIHYGCVLGRPRYSAAVPRGLRSRWLCCR